MDIKDTDVVKLNTDEYRNSGNYPFISLGKYGVIGSVSNSLGGDLGSKFLTEGFKGALLRPGADWVQGKYYLRLEFVPDEQLVAVDSPDLVDG